MSMADYTSKIKEICESLVSNMTIEGEYTFVFQPTIDVDHRSKPLGCIDEHAHKKQDVIHGGGSARNGGGLQE